MGRKLLLQKHIANSDSVLSLLEEFIHPCKHDGQIGKDLHFLGHLVIDVIVGEIGLLEAVVHALESLYHCGDSLVEDLVVEIQGLENRKEVVPELDSSVKNEPSLVSLGPLLNGLDNVISKLSFPVVESLLVFVGEVSLVLVSLEGNHIFEADLNFFFQEVVGKALGQDGVRLALSNYKILVFGHVPLLFDCEGG